MLIRKLLGTTVLAMMTSCSFTYAQTSNLEHVSVLQSIDPANDNYADLEGLRQSIGKSRIVLLGEQTHGEASTFLAKTRMIKFLHEKMGFDVLAFESGFYDCARIWENTLHGSPFVKELPGSLFYMYATSKQMMPLFDYIQANIKSASPLTVTGFESQHTGQYAKQQLFPDFEQFLKQQHPALVDDNWALFRRVSLATFPSNTYRPTAEEQQTFFRELDKLKTVLSGSKNKSTHFTTSPGFWYQVTCSIESQAKRYWGLTTGNELSVRDKQMADNLIWLAEKAFPGKKIIVWAHNIHIAKNTSELEYHTGGPVPFLQTLVPMGATISRHFGKDAYAIGFSGAAGNYIDYTNDKLTAVPLPQPASVEAQFTGYQNAFLDYRTAKGWLQQPQQSTLFDFNPLKGIWPHVFDGLVFIRTSIPVDR
ncbi:erythromycin esterase family protein [Chitinophaga sp. HK235]|uniref:erythromycin esterase family protein n=1 Tax=Chitinophaga sp. HK235 TaxID=2952571 RepID=UPI001BA90951|nr:erythromycin esterase family protein [Chitinophaga sp. HK235]